jgi:hypothetical protein
MVTACMATVTIAIRAYRIHNYSAISSVASVSNLAIALVIIIIHNVYGYLVFLGYCSPLLNNIHRKFMNDLARSAIFPIAWCHHIDDVIIH